MLDNKIFDELKEYGIYKNFTPKNIIYSPQTSDKVFFYIISGKLQQYYKVKEKIHVFRLINDNDFCESASFLKGRKNEFEFIETISEVSLLEINYNKIKPLIDINLHFSNLFLNILENYILEQEKRIIELISLNPKERYNKFINENSDKIGKFPDKVIASYLGITKESMSRFRNKKLI